MSDLDKQEQQLYQYSKLVDEKEEWKYKVNSTMLLSSATVFSIVVSVSTTTGIKLSGLLFSAAVATNGLSLLFFMVLLFNQLYLYRRVEKDARLALSNRIRKQNDSTCSSGNNGDEKNRHNDHNRKEPLQSQVHSTGQKRAAAYSVWHGRVQGISFFLYASWVILYVLFIIMRDCY